MSLLMLRLCELRDEHFKHLSVHCLSVFHDRLDKDKQYRTDHLIQELDMYCFELGLESFYQKIWIDPAGGMHYEDEIDPTDQYM
jgi:hypothetical protein